MTSSLGEPTFSELDGTWNRLFRQQMWVAKARFDDAVRAWQIWCVDHDGRPTPAQSRCGSLTPEQAVDEAELLCPE